MHPKTPMFARPSKRDRTYPETFRPPSEGSYLDGVLKKTCTDRPSEPAKRQRVMYESAYLKALEKNNNDLGIPYVEPVFVPYQPPAPREETSEPDLPFVDRIYVNFKILKSGVVRIKIVPNFLLLYENYYRRALRPPLKLLLAAYKARGFSKDFLDGVKAREQKAVAFFSKKVPGILEKVFEKEPSKKVRKKQPPPPVDEDEPPETEEEEEDNTMDVEPDDDAEEENVEEDYFSADDD